MRMLFVVSGADTPSTRFRILAYLPLLEAAGHQCDVAYSFPQKYDYFKAIGWRLSQRLKRTVRHIHAWQAQRKKYDAIIIEREVFDDDTWELETKFRDATERLVLDVDDGIFLLHPEKFDRVARMCDVAIAGNAWLKAYLDERCTSVVQIPTCVRMADYPLRPATAQRKDFPTVGWIGTTGNVAFLSVASEALRAVSETIPFRLLVVAPSDEKLPTDELSGIKIDFRKWDPRTEVNHIRDMDLGLMPLPAGEDWMKYKCGLKLIQYLAVGIPGIASPIGVNEEILGDHRLGSDHCVGRAASNTQQWKEALRELLSSVPLRQQLGSAGRELVEQKYSIEANWRKLEQAIQG